MNNNNIIIIDRRLVIYHYYDIVIYYESIIVVVIRHRYLSPSTISRCHRSVVGGRQNKSRVDDGQR